MAPKSRTQEPRELELVMPTKDVLVPVVCATEVMKPEFSPFSYHLRNTLKAAKVVIDEVRETILKEGEKNPKNSNKLRSRRMVNSGFTKKKNNLTQGSPYYIKIKEK